MTRRLASAHGGKALGGNASGGKAPGGKAPGGKAASANAPSVRTPGVRVPGVRTPSPPARSSCPRHDSPWAGDSRMVTPQQEEGNQERAPADPRCHFGTRSDQDRRCAP